MRRRAEDEGRRARGHRLSYTVLFHRKSLSIDNVFVISLIFGFFAIPRKYQYRALVWGILAVIVLRGIMIAIGASVVERYSWVLYIFGAFLIATGVKMLIVPESDPTSPRTRW